MIEKFDADNSDNDYEAIMQIIQKNMSTMKAKSAYLVITNLIMSLIDNQKWDKEKYLEYSKKVWELYENREFYE